MVGNWRLGVRVASRAGVIGDSLIFRFPFLFSFPFPVSLVAECKCLIQARVRVCVSTPRATDRPLPSPLTGSFPALEPHTGLERPRCCAPCGFGAVPHPSASTASKELAVPDLHMDLSDKAKVSQHRHGRKYHRNHKTLWQQSA